jgi:glycosyltransferase involved in cell wall biosynthesis
MRVLILSPFGTAINPYIGLLSEGLASAGAEVCNQRVLTPNLLREPISPHVIHLHWVERYDLPLQLQPRASAGLRRRVERIALRPANAGPLYWVRRWSRLRTLFDLLTEHRRAGGRIAYTVHNLDPHDAGFAPERWASRAMLAWADVLHVHDQATADEIRQRHPAARRIEVIPHGHYLAAYPNTLDRGAARLRLGLPPEAFVFVSLGLLRPYKGLEELLPAFRLLKGDHLRLVIAGKPADAEYLARLRALQGEDPRVLLESSFIPEDEVQVYLNAADIAVLPYRQITTSGAAILAFSFGLPVIAPAIGAFPGLVTEDRGILYEPGALLAALDQAQAGEWHARGLEILEWVAQFDWKGIGERLLAAYRV